MAGGRGATENDSGLETEARSPFRLIFPGLRPHLASAAVFL
jgi:hypothetical protein